MSDLAELRENIDHYKAKAKIHYTPDDGRQMLYINNIPIAWVRPNDGSAESAKIADLLCHIVNMGLNEL